MFGYFVIARALAFLSSYVFRYCSHFPWTLTRQQHLFSVGARSKKIYTRKLQFQQENLFNLSTELALCCVVSVCLCRALMLLFMHCTATLLCARETRNWHCLHVTRS